MKILIIGPYAPQGQVGAIRIISLSRYLINHGHEVTVMCLSENSLMELDAKGLSSSVPRGVKTITYDISSSKKGLLKQNFLNSRLLNQKLNNLLLSQKFDIALVSAGPFYTFLSMKIFKKMKIPYVVDYRDINISSKAKRKKESFIKSLKFYTTFPFRFYQEYFCIKNANSITVVHPEMKKNISKFFHINESKIEVIYNGYDDYVLKDIKPTRKEDVFTIGYFGKLMYYDKAYTKMLFKAINAHYSKGMKIRFLHIGPENLEIDDYCKKWDINYQLWYHSLGLLDYSIGMAHLGSCDVFAVEYAMSEGPGTKIFDYIYWNKPVIAITKPKIALEGMINSFDNGFVCHSSEDVENAIKIIQNENLESLVAPQKVIIRDNYARSIQNKNWEKLLSNIGKQDVR